MKASVNQLEVKLHVFYTLPESKTEIQKTLIHMKKRFLRLKTAMRAVMLILIMGVVGVTEGFAQNFSAECPSGQTLYYQITDNENHYVTVVSPTLFGYHNLNGKMTIPDVVTNVNDSISYQVTSIGEYAFYDCTSLTSLTIGNSVTSMGSCAFAKCTGLKSVEIPNSVTSIGDAAFDGCKGLTSLTIPNSVTSIGGSAFAGCTGLKSLTIGNLVESIGYAAFAGCEGLTSLTIPNSVTSIGDHAFYGCAGLTSLTIGNSVTSIGECAFYQCTGLTSVEIPNSVTSIGDNAFSGCTGLKSVEIPNSVKSIGDSAFSGCTGLTSLTIGNSVTSIGGFAFIGCSSVTSLTIPNSVKSIGDHAFYQCTGLTSLTIGNNVDTIKVAAFADCIGLSMMMVKASTPPTLTDSNVFTGVTTSIPVYVPNDSLSAYQSADVWSNFTNYQPMVDASITGYGSSTDSDHWVFIASPLASSVLPTAVYGLVADPVENYDLYRFNQSGNNNDGEWENYKNKVHTDGFVLENGKGYLYANKNDVTLTFVGDMNTTAPKEVKLDYDDKANLPGWNLIGNPFTEAAYINRSYYKMNPEGTDVLPVATYENTPVAAYSGIMVHAETSGESVTFTKSGSKSSDNGGLQITLSKAGVRGDEAQDKVIVSFNKYAQLSKFIFNEDNAKLYIPMGGEDYAIAYSDRQSNMPLYFKTKEMGIYTMSFEGAIDNIKIIDNLGGSVIDLNAEKSFTFVGTPSDRNDRFTIVFNTPATEDFAYQSGDGIVVNGEGELQVFDIMGRMVAKYHVNGVETVNIPCQSGVYVLRLLGKETNTQKIVVK